ncbi:alpha/beta hydrolase family protein [Subtercola endophyticus]|uniref:alpha/beta hydrolase family protein n=1 Tax=Subtercola endophyticus TaxID=2895559 RepID=UPI001E56538A|nr:alpha/beta fold hydrolase [Subtercola endophyticus]UFS59179.1 alpha/beta hydrolase [Subtercola endophyticus]
MPPAHGARTASPSVASIEHGITHRELTENPPSTNPEPTERPRTVQTEQLTISGARPIPATLSIASPGAPAVLLLHGTASSRDEVAGLFVQLADALASRGVSSLRIDFAGCGASTRPQTEFTVTSQLDDARAALAWLTQDARVDAARIAVLGFSQGGMIATLLAGRAPEEVAALTLWSSGIVPGGAFTSFAPYFENNSGEAVTIDLGYTTFTFSREWWREASALNEPSELGDPGEVGGPGDPGGASSLNLGDAIGRYGHPLLAVVGSDDDVVPPQASLDLIARAGSRDIELRMLAGGDHIFRALETDPAPARAAVRLTAEWFADRLTQ